MRVTLRKTVAVILALSALYIVYGLRYMTWRRTDGRQSRLAHINHPQAHDKKLNGTGQHLPSVPAQTNRAHHSKHVVEIWGKAAIGLYLWEHILGGPLEDRLGGVWQYGTATVDQIKFQFRTGPGVVQDKVPQDVQNLVLVLNGREPAKVEFAKSWLDYIPSYTNLRNLAVILLGNEECHNEWLKHYVTRFKDVLKAVFLVYDSADVDDKLYFQWPLGVATYREFPVFEEKDVPVGQPRWFLCNFMGTVYVNSSRQTLLKIAEQQKLNHICHIKTRNSWLPQETDETRTDYIKVLRDSDLTLNPVGKNTECYRIYEAMSLGSIPVIEDVMTHGRCGAESDSQHKHALRLLKKHKAPVEYIKNWQELPGLLERYQKMPIEELVARRTKVLSWYTEFKQKMRDYFVGILTQKFFAVKD